MKQTKTPENIKIHVGVALTPEEVRKADALAKFYDVSRSALIARWICDQYNEKYANGFIQPQP